MKPELQHIVSLLKQTFDGNAWHGPTVRETLALVSEQQASHRLPDTHSIIELVAHMTAWRRYLLKKLAGDLSYKVTDEMNFPQTGDWGQAVRELEDTQYELLKALESLPLENMAENVPWTKEPFSYYSILHGIIHHDLYHIGQINLIRKSAPKQSI